MSNDMKNLRDRLISRLGESYGRVRFMWLCQKYNVMPWDERFPVELLNEIRAI